MRLLWVRLDVWLRRAWCRTFGCVPPHARRHFIAGESTRMAMAVTVHCKRCWRRYGKAEQQRAVERAMHLAPGALR